MIQRSDRLKQAASLNFLDKEVIIQVRGISKTKELGLCVAN